MWFGASFTRLPSKLFRGGGANMTTSGLGQNGNGARLTLFPQRPRIRGVAARFTYDMPNDEVVGNRCAKRKDDPLRDHDHCLRREYG